MSALTFTAADFTEARYREVLRAALARFHFVSLDQAVADDCTRHGIALWRHDIDISPHRALKLARIEAELGLASVWFVHLGSAFYNPMEPVVAAILREISRLGHEIGLHFDCAASRAGDGAGAEEELRVEALALAAIVEAPVSSFSLHNPTVPGGASLDSLRHGGLINASAPALYNRFSYCSDSNGIWRFRSLHELIADPDTRRLYALTHPVWWTPEEMVPRDRVRRAIEGRASTVLAGYDALLAENARPNVT